MARKSINRLINLVDSATNVAPVEKQFITDLTYSIEKQDEKTVRNPSKTFKPSSIGGCERAIYYQLTGTKQAEGHSSSNTVGILESGTDRHIRIQEAICAMKENGIDCEYIDVADFVQSRGIDKIEIVSKTGIETKCFWAELPMSFLTDGIIRYKGKYYILEIKTMNTRKFLESRDTRSEHMAQGISYSMAFGIDDVLYLYECRDTLEKKAFVFHVTQKMKDELMEKVDRIKWNVKNNSIPSKCDNERKCTYCPYKEQCNIDN